MERNPPKGPHSYVRFGDHSTSGLPGTPRLLSKPSKSKGSGKKGSPDVICTLLQRVTGQDDARPVLPRCSVQLGHPPATPWRCPLSTLLKNAAPQCQPTQESSPHQPSRRLVCLLLPPPSLACSGRQAMRTAHKETSSCWQRRTGRRATVLGVLAQPPPGLSGSWRLGSPRPSIGPGPVRGESAEGTPPSKIQREALAGKHKGEMEPRIFNLPRVEQNQRETETGGLDGKRLSRSTTRKRNERGGAAGKRKQGDLWPQPGRTWGDQSCSAGHSGTNLGKGNGWVANTGEQDGGGRTQPASPASRGLAWVSQPR